MLGAGGNIFEHKVSFGYPLFWILSDSQPVFGTDETRRKHELVGALLVAGVSKPLVARAGISALLFHNNHANSMPSAICFLSRSKISSLQIYY